MAVPSCIKTSAFDGYCSKCGDTVEHAVRSGRGCWLQLIRGQAIVNGAELHVGDGASTNHPGLLRISAQNPVEALLFDLN